MAGRALRIRVGRVYDAPSDDDGLRILVDRLWPRGIAKTALKLDLWAKDVAPSNALRQWFHRDLTQFDAFQERYRAELAQNEAAFEALRSSVGRGPALLLTASKNPDHSHATVLRDLLVGR